MPFGLTNASATWQRLIDKVLGADLEPFVFVYLDYIIITSSDFDTHLKILGQVFVRLISAGLTEGREKCSSVVLSCVMLVVWSVQKKLRWIAKR